MTFLSKTISQYIGSNIFSYLAFLVFAVIVSVFLIKLSKKFKNKISKILFLIFIVSFLGLAVFPYGLFNETVSSIHQIFADAAFLSSLAFATSLFFSKRKNLSLTVFILYSITFILMYIFRFTPFQETELIWESLYFILLLAILFMGF